jgi:hypothetical protein
MCSQCILLEAHFSHVHILGRLHHMKLCTTLTFTKGIWYSLRESGNRYGTLTFSNQYENRNLGKRIWNPVLDSDIRNGIKIFVC